MAWLARRRETLAQWCQKVGVSDYGELAFRMGQMGAELPSHEEWSRAESEIRAARRERRAAKKEKAAEAAAQEPAPSADTKPVPTPAVDEGKTSGDEKPKRSSRRRSRASKADESPVKESAKSEGEADPSE